MIERTTLGIDLSLSRTGVAIVKGDKTKTWSVSTTPRMGSTEKRINFIWTSIAEVIDKHSPEYALIEGPAFGKNHSQFVMGELAGVIKHNLFVRKVPSFDLVPPPTLKKFGTGSGKATKDEMLEAALVIRPQVKNHDEADALFLALKAQEVLNQGRADVGSL